MDFTWLILSLPTISLKTESSSEFNDYRSGNPFDEVGGANWFKRCAISGARGTGGGTGWSRRVGTAGILGRIDIEWNPIVDVVSYYPASSMARRAPVFLVPRGWALGNWELNWLTIVAASVTSFLNTYPCFTRAGHLTSWWYFSLGNSLVLLSDTRYRSGQCGSFPLWVSKGTLL